jgi:Domain of unknown function (DUF5069)
MHTRSALYRNDSVKEQLPRSPYDMVGGVIYFPRMLDKIRLHARGALPETYHNNLGREFEDHCLTFLHIEYGELRERVLAGGSDEEILEWCFTNGRRPNAGEIQIFNGFMQKAGWRDHSSERLGSLLQASGLPPSTANARPGLILSSLMKVVPRPIFVNGNRLGWNTLQKSKTKPHAKTQSLRQYNGA